MEILPLSLSKIYFYDTEQFFEIFPKIKSQTV